MKFKDFPELTEILPPLAQDDYSRLKESIRQKGIQQKIKVLKDGTIIDGVHRKKIAEELKLKDIPFEEIKNVDKDGVLELGLELNIARRHLSHEQKIEISIKLRQRGFTQEQAGRLVGLDQSTISKLEDRSIMKNHITPIPDQRYTISKEAEDEIVKRTKEGKETQRQIASDYGIDQTRVSQITRKAKAREKKPEPIGKISKPKEKFYKALTIDPPWPVKKIERDVRPDQGKILDYPVMSIEQIKELPITEWASSKGCHIYLWATHKFLPVAFEIFEEWTIKYECLLTWVKNVGFTPFSWMYSTEHILFGRIGNLPVLKKGTRLDFKAKVREHSRKPDEFYDIVKKVSPGPRLDVFSREKRKGFDQYGGEVTKFV